MQRPTDSGSPHGAVATCHDLDLREPIDTGGGTHTPTSTSDAELRRVVDEHARAAYRVALAVVRDPSLAEDVVQETIVKVWRHLDDLRDDASERGWVLRIAHNTAVSTLRTIRDVATDPATLPERPTVIGPDRRATGRVALTALDRALDDMDPTSRSVVVLREIEGMRYDDIAVALDIPVSTVKTRLFRARRQLAIALEDWA